MSRWLFPRLNYDCVQCGKSCGGWRVLVDDEARGRLQHHPLVEAVRAQGYQPFLQGPDGLWRLDERADGRCHYLRSDRLCAIHADTGFESKPRACRQFPFFMVETPEGTQVGLSFRCTAVQRNSGRPVAVHQGDLEPLRATGSYPRRGFGEIPLTLTRPGAWSDYQLLEAYVLEALATGPLSQGLWQAAAGVGRSPRGPYRPGPPQDELMRALEGLLAASLIGYLETDRPEEMHPITQALRAGQPFLSRRLGRAIDPGALPQPSGVWLEQEARRYLTHLVVRRYLLEGPSVLGRLVGLSVLWPVLVFYSRVFASLEGPMVGEAHYHRALEVVEGEVVGHVQPLESFFTTFEESFLNHLG